MFLALLSAVALSSAGCGRTDVPGGGPGDGDASSKPVIVASIYPLADLTEKLVFGWAEVHTFLPPGASEHTYEVTPDQLRLIAKADVVIVVGMNLDAAVERTAREKGKPGVRIIRFEDLVRDRSAATAESRPDAPIGETSAHSAASTEPAADHEPAEHEHADDDDDHDHHGEDAHAGHDHHGPDPHLWLDPLLAERFVMALGGQLEPTVGENVAALRTRKRLLAMNIHMLHQEYEAKIGKLANRRLVTFHNAFDPLCARYGLEVVAHLTEIEETPGGDVKPRRLREVRDAVRQYNLKVLYSEPQLPDGAIEAIREQTGVRILKLDPLGHPNVEGYRGYVEMMKSNLQTLVEGQSIR